jgi:hypothetical protein
VLEACVLAGCLFVLCALGVAKEVGLVAEVVVDHMVRILARHFIVTWLNGR